MPNAPKSIVTRFRAYQLGQAGASFSYFAGGHFTLMEAVVTDTNKAQLLGELKACNKKTIDTLHITSWDQDHCDQAGLDWILRNVVPTKIEYPGYEPHTECGRACLKAIQAYQAKWTDKGISIHTKAITPEFISNLNPAKELEYNDIFYHPKALKDNSNDNSTIKFFRGGSFNVLSLGDVEDVGIASMLRRCKTLCRETDVLILAHHGADNGFTTKALLEKLGPRVAICSSNYDNQFDHPRQEIRDLLFEQGIPLYTTKTGDILIHSVRGHSRDFQVTNLIGDSTKISSQKEYKAKKYHWLSINGDSLRNLLHPGFKGLR